MTNLPTTDFQNLPIGSVNTAVAITAIVTIGICYCVTIATSAKYNRDVEMTFGDFSAKISSSVPVATIPA